MSFIIIHEFQSRAERDMFRNCFIRIELLDFQCILSNVSIDKHKIA